MLKNYQRTIKISKNNWTFGFWRWKHKFGINIGPLVIVWTKYSKCTYCNRRCYMEMSFCCMDCHKGVVMKTKVSSHTMICDKVNGVYA